MGLFVFAVLLVASFVTFAALSLAQAPKAQIVRLPPAAFRELPTNLVKEIQRRECSIQQETYSKKRSNVIKGEFAKPGQTDWAPYSARSRAIPLFSSFGMDRRRIPPPSRQQKIASILKASRSISSGIQGE